MSSFIENLARRAMGITPVNALPPQPQAKPFSEDGQPEEAMPPGESAGEETAGPAEPASEAVGSRAELRPVVAPFVMPGAEPAAEPSSQLARSLSVSAVQPADDGYGTSRQADKSGEAPRRTPGKGMEQPAAAGVMPAATAGFAGSPRQAEGPSERLARLEAVSQVPATATSAQGDASSPAPSRDRAGSLRPARPSAAARASGGPLAVGRQSAAPDASAASAQPFEQETLPEVRTPRGESVHATSVAPALPGWSGGQPAVVPRPEAVPVMRRPPEQAKALPEAPSVYVHIGTVEVKAAAPPAPTPARRPVGEGFGDYTRIRTYRRR